MKAGTKIPFRSEIGFAYGEIRELAPGLRRLVVNNPGPFTYTGTNCYILGEGTVGVVDPGPADEAHLQTLLDVLSGEQVSHIILTHTHLDHSGCVQALKEATGAKTYGFVPVGSTRGTGEQTPSGVDFADSGFVPDVPVQDGDLIEGDGWRLRAIHTPGHAPDHLCFDILDTQILLSGDHVMSWNTSVIAPPEGHMGDYIRSLEKLLDTDSKLFFPGHGGRVESPRRVVKAFLVHRSWREAAIVESIRNGSQSISDIVNDVYKDLNPQISTAASFSVLAHAVFLVERGKLCVLPQPGASSAVPSGAPTLLSSFALP